MKNRKENPSVAKIIVAALLLAILVLIFNPAWIPFLPQGVRDAIQGFTSTNFFFLDGQMPLPWQSVLAAAIALLCAWAATALVRAIPTGSRSGKRRSQTIRSIVSGIVVALFWIAGIVIALRCLGVDVTAILVGAGILGIVVGFGAQSVIEDAITGIFIVCENRFNVGDIITIDGFRGEVMSIGLRNVSIMDPGGNIRIINNSQIASLVNLSNAVSSAVITVPVCYDDPLCNAEAALRQALTSLPDLYPDVFKKEPLYKGVELLGESWIELQVVAQVAEKDIYNARRLMQREIKLAFERAHLKTPFEG